MNALEMDEEDRKESLLESIDYDLAEDQEVALDSFTNDTPSSFLDELCNNTESSIPKSNKEWTNSDNVKLRQIVMRYHEMNWKHIATYFPGKTNVECMQQWKYVVNPRVGRGQWTLKEDNKLKKLVSMHGRKWKMIADHLPKREPKRCRERYMNHLQPALSLHPWTENEERLLLNEHTVLGNQWARIARLLPGRTATQTKNHYHALSRRQDTIDANVSKVQVDAYSRRWTKEEEALLEKAMEQFGSKNWSMIAKLVPGRSAMQCNQHWRTVFMSKVKGKGSWTPEEDAKLIERIGILGKKWAKIAEYMPGRIGKQCRERYVNYLDPTINREPWTEEEEQILISKHKNHFNKWSYLATYLPGRTESAVRNHWYSISNRPKSESILTTSEFHVGIPAFEGVMTPNGTVQGGKDPHCTL